MTGRQFQTWPILRRTAVICQSRQAWQSPAAPAASVRRQRYIAVPSCRGAPCGRIGGPDPRRHPKPTCRMRRHGGRRWAPGPPTWRQGRRRAKATIPPPGLAKDGRAAPHAENSTAWKYATHAHKHPDIRGNALLLGLAHTCSWRALRLNALVVVLVVVVLVSLLLLILLILYPSHCYIIIIVTIIIIKPTFSSSEMETVLLEAGSAATRLLPRPHEPAIRRCPSRSELSGGREPRTCQATEARARQRDRRHQASVQEKSVSSG